MGSFQIQWLTKRFGSIPKSWGRVPLGDLFEERRETSSDTTKYPLHSLIIGLGIVPKTDRYNRAFLLRDEKENQYKLVYPGDFVFNPMNLRFGAIAYSRCESVVAVSAYYNVLKPRRNRFDTQYLYELLISHPMVDLYDLVAIGSLIEKRRVHWSEFRKLVVQLPPLGEQKAIGSVIRSWDKALTLTERLITAKRQRKKALMQQLLTGQWRFKEFENTNWVSCRIGDLLKVVKRPVVWSDEDTYSLISIKRRSGGLFLRQRVLGKDIKTKSMYVARKGDFLISKMQVVHGACALTTDEFDGMHISGSYIALVAKDPSLLNVEFFNWLSRMPFMYHLAYISSYGVHIEKMTFNLQDYLRRTINIPGDIAEQNKIVSVLSAAEKGIRLLTQQRDAL